MCFVIIPDYYVQAEYHTDIAKKMVVNNMQFSSSTTEKTHVLLMMMNLYYIMGKAACQLKKYVAIRILYKQLKFLELKIMAPCSIFAFVILQ